MQRSRLVFGLAAVFAGMTTLLVVLAAVLRDPVVFLVALPFGAATYLFWHQASGRLRERMRERAGRRTRERGGRGGFGAGPREEWVPPGDRRRRAGGRYRRARQRYREADAGEGPTDAEAYRRLDLKVGADEAAVRAAYREKVKEVHPDRPGGDEEAFKRVNDAYERLVEE